MKKQHIIASTLFLLSLLSCTGVIRDNQAEHVIKVSDIDPQRATLSQLVTKVKYIHLEKEEGNLVGRIDKILFETGRWFILDSKGSKAVHIFTDDGKLIGCISNRGRGPGEYLKPKDISFNDQTGELLLYCSDQKKIIAYTMDGEFTREWPDQLWFDSFEYLGDQNYIAFTNNRYNSIPGFPDLNYDLIRFDEEINILDTYFPNEVVKNYGKLTFSFGKTFFHKGEEVFFLKTFEDTLYRIEQGLVKPEITIDFGRDKIPGYIKNNVRELVDQLNLGSYSCIVSVEFAGENAFISYIADGAISYIFYNMQTGTARRISKIKNDLDEAVFTVPIASRGEELIFAIYPDEILEDVDSGMVLIGKEPVEVSISDNPILMMMKINPKIFQ